MASLQDHIAVLPERLLDGLQYKLRDTANYVLRKDQSTAFPASGNTFSPTGIRVLRFNLANVGYLVPKSVRVNCSFNNKDATANHAVKPLGTMSSMFSRMRILCGGVIIEDIVEFSRVNAMLQK